VPEDLDARASDCLVRTVIAGARNYLDPGRPDAERTARTLWPDDGATGLLVKSATNPATLTTSGWASQLAATAVADFIQGLGPASAGAALLARGLQFQFGGKAAILAPGAISAASLVGFVTEGAPIPVTELALTGPTLTPRKFAVISAYTRESFEHSLPNIEALVRTVLSESVALALDAALLDDTVGDTSRPAGLRNGIAATAASAATPVSEAMYEDLSTLAGLVALVAGSSPIVFVASPMQAHAIKMRQPNFAYEVLASNALEAGVVIAVASNALVSATAPVPRFEVSDKATIHLEDTTPLQVGVAGSPNTVAAPTKSLWQSDLLSIRLVMEVSWALRTSAGLAWTESVTW
jgi:Phage capsid family